MIHRFLHSIAAGLLITGILASPAATQQEDKYTDYKPLATIETLYKILFTENKITLTVVNDTTETTVTRNWEHVENAPARVTITDDVYFDETGLHFHDSVYTYDRITDTRVMDSDDGVTIAFLTVRGDVDRLARLRRGNRISFAEPQSVESTRFVRGLIMTIRGNIDIQGEVNKDVITLFGDVYVGPGAVVRGDIASLQGKIDAADDAQIYGELYSGTEHFTKRRHRFYRDDDYVEVYVDFNYNRVDGTRSLAGVKFEDIDSLLPTAWAQAGYAFNSKRWRTEVGLEQTILRARPLAIGGAYYRRLASEDDWLLSDNENTAFSLLVTEDFKDYWEGKGARAWIRFEAFPALSMKAQYRYEETNWHPAQRHLWSLFGGDKLFPKNFRKVDDPEYSQGIAEIDTTINANLTFTIDWDSHDDNGGFYESGWHVSGDFEWSNPDLNSDFDYRRYSLTLRRYQRIHDRSMLLLRTKYAGSDGYLPMNKRYYMGGLGTQRGYAHKEMAGNRYWLANAEYRFLFPKTDLAAALFWDLGQIADGKIDSDIEIEQSLGVAVMFSDDLRLSLAKRLDRSDDAWKIYARLEHVF